MGAQGAIKICRVGLNNASVCQYGNVIKNQPASALYLCHETGPTHTKANEDTNNSACPQFIHSFRSFLFHLSPFYGLFIFKGQN